MAILINRPYEIIALVAFLISFVWLAARKFNFAVGAALFCLPLYLIKIKLFFAPFNVSEILIWILSALWLGRAGFKNIQKAEIKKFALPALLILIGTMISVLFSKNIIVSAGILKGWFLAPLFLALIIAAEFKKEAQKKALLFSIFASSVVVALIGLVYFMLGKISFDGRLSAFFLSPNYLAMYLAPGLLIGLWFLGGTSKNQRTKAFEKTSSCQSGPKVGPAFGFLFAPRQRLGYQGLFFTKTPSGNNAKIFYYWPLAIVLIGLILIGAALYLTFSYLAWLAIFFSALVWLLISFKQKLFSKKTFVICLLLSIFLIIVLFFSQLNSEKLNNLLGSSRSSLQSRLMIWRAAEEIIKDHPLFGIGPGLFQKYYLAYQDHFALPYLEWAVPEPHNIFLAFWLEGGLLGLVGFIWLMISFFKKNLMLIKQKNQLALILVTIMIYTILHGLADTTYFKNDLSAIFWTIFALAASL